MDEPEATTSVLDLQNLDVEREAQDGPLADGGGSTLSVALC
jgi:hypothetical protein